MNLFIDTNVLLGFFHFSKDSLEELEKILILQNNGKICLWLTDQVEMEFDRNRETKIADALKKFLDEKPNSGIPHVARGYPESDELMEALKQLTLSREQLIKKVKSDIAGKSLLADKLIAEIFNKSTRIQLSDEQFSLAKKRLDLRNPPGKNNSLGDAINWEGLLASTPDGEDLFLVSEDGDYASPLESEQLSTFLADEWTAKKKSTAKLYKRISQFLSEKFPGAEVAAEYEKDLLIADLVGSRSFASTHYAIAALAPFPGFSAKQASAIADAYIANDQVSWIAKDEDVNEFGKKIAAAHGGTLDPEQLKAFLGVLN
jgi:predicted nucleic acid-binding protein